MASDRVCFDGIVSRPSCSRFFVHSDEDMSLAVGRSVGMTVSVAEREQEALIASGRLLGEVRLDRATPSPGVSKGE